MCSRWHLSSLLTHPRSELALLMKFSCNCVLDTNACGYTCLSHAAFIIQSVLISLIAAAWEEQPGKHFKCDGCADECVLG